MSSLQKILLIVASIVVVGGVVGYVLVSTAASAMEYYKHVDEVTPEMARWEGRPLELHGYVQPGTVMKRLDRNAQKLEYKFTEVNCGKTIEVRYAGVVPDTFKDGAEVVVKGQLHEGVFQANEVMAKCPSKYQMQTGPMTMCATGKAN